MGKPSGWVVIVLAVFSLLVAVLGGVHMGINLGR